MFSIDELVRDCRGALQTADPSTAVAEVVADAVRDPEQVLAALGPVDGIGMTTYASGPELTVQRIVWGPGVVSTVHEHTVWVTVGVLAGSELNVRYDVHGDRLQERGRTHVGPGEALLLRADEAHAVLPSDDGLTQALHVYGGDINGLPRREWVGGAPRLFDVGTTVTAVTAYNGWTARHGRTPTAQEGAALLREVGYPLPALRPVP